MINIFLTNLHNNTAKYNSFYNYKNFKISYDGKCKTWKNKNKEKFFFFGKVYEKIKTKDLENPKKSNKLEGSFIIIKVSKNNDLEIWTDKFAKEDLFYKTKNNNYFVSTSLENLEVSSKKSGYDKFGISQSLIIYGNRPSKKNTFYKNINRLGYYETLKIQNDKIKILKQDLDIVNSENYQKNHINNYFDNFIEALEKILQRMIISYFYHLVGIQHQSWLV